jgi:isoamylase
LLSGDELGRTQQGNNNAYCQDNEISWINWADADEELLNFTQKLIQFRKNHPVFCRRRWFQGRQYRGVEDIAWFKPDGSEMQEENWQNDFAKSLGIYFNGHGIYWPGPKGEHIVDDSFYVIFNAHVEPLAYKLPEEKYGDKWIKVLDTDQNSINDVEEGAEFFNAGNTLMIEPHAVVVLKHILTHDRND